MGWKHLDSTNNSIRINEPIRRTCRIVGLNRSTTEATSSANNEKPYEANRTISNLLPNNVSTVAHELQICSERHEREFLTRRCSWFALWLRWVRRRLNVWRSIFSRNIFNAIWRTKLFHTLKYSNRINEVASISIPNRKLERGNPSTAIWIRILWNVDVKSNWLVRVIRACENS